jgi:hypothetical protein
LPSLVIMYCIILPVPAASAMAEPDMPAKMIALHDVDLREAAAEAADQRVAEAQQALGHRAEFMSSAARMNSGTARMT